MAASRGRAAQDQAACRPGSLRSTQDPVRALVEERDRFHSF